LSVVFLLKKTTGDRYVALVVPPSVPSFYHRRHHYSPLGDFATAGVYDRAAVFRRSDDRQNRAAGGDFGGFASSAFWLVFSGFVLGIAIRKTGLADRRPGRSRRG
jgi:hypothetical protein